MTGADIAFGLFVWGLIFAFSYRVTEKQRRAARARGDGALIKVDARIFQIAGVIFLVVAVAQGILAGVTGRGWPVAVCAVNLAFAGSAFVIAKSRRESKRPDT